MLSILQKLKMTDPCKENMYHSAELSDLSSSDGSALMSIGDTFIHAAVYGPTDVRISKELHNKAFIDVTYKPKSSQSACKGRLAEYIIKNCFQSTIPSVLHSRTRINIIIEEIQDGGSIFACSVNAVYLALLKAGVPMNGSVVAVSVGVFKDKIVAFPPQEDIKYAECMTTICIRYPGEYIVDTNCSSFLQEDEFKACIAVAKMSAKDVRQFYEEAVKKGLLKTSKIN